MGYNKNRAPITAGSVFSKKVGARSGSSLDSRWKAPPCSSSVLLDSPPVGVELYDHHAGGGLETANYANDSSYAAAASELHAILMAGPRRPGGWGPWQSRGR